jgi:gamma-D-glutamyl-L-lysine dipeptidyl-peptidase
VPARDTRGVSALFLTLLALAAPHPGQHATIDVSVATLWQSPSSPRRIDAPALRDPVDLDAWNRNLASTAARAGLGGRVVTQALYGENVIVLKVENGWAKVAVPGQPSPLDRRGYPGWLPLRQLVTGYDGSGRAKTVVTRTATLYLGSRKLVLSYGTRLPVTGTTPGGAWRVRTPDGPGTMLRSKLATPPRLTGARVVAEAKRFLGLRYLWGGTSAWGFDCSGLVWNVFHALGKTVPRDTGPQSRAGKRVTGALRPGDLVFYGSPAYHVAIVAGNGMMIESPDSAHAVRIVPLRRGYSAARRYA